LTGALDRLDPALRTTLVLVELEGETCVEVAAALGVPIGTIYWRLHTARRRFREAVQALTSDPASTRSRTEGIPT
jgi:RNA polymerase sigma-70 factor (ECF subfamily)